MQKVVSNSFAITAAKDAVSFDHNDNYSLIEASGNMPSANDSRWQFIPVGGQALKPTSAAPYLWHKTITFLTDGSHLEPVISFGGSMGQNGIDYDLVPSVSCILKAENGTLTPANVTCAIVKRNADGSAENLSSIPSGYTIRCFRDSNGSNYSLGQQISTSGISVISFVLQYNGTDIERYDIRVITEGSQGIDGRGIQSQDYRFKATDSATAPQTPTNETQWNTWLTLAGSNYSEQLPYLWKCIRTVYVDGSGKTDTEYHVEGPTVWGQSPTHVVTVYGCSRDNDNDAVYSETNNQNPCRQKFMFDKSVTAQTMARGFVLEVLDPRTGERKLTTGNTFDTYGSSEEAGQTNATNLANTIYNYINTDYLICIASHDACAMNVALINMLRNFGLGKEVVSFTRARKAFVFVGQVGLDYGQATYKFMPDAGSLATVKATVTDGQLVPSMAHQSIFEVDIDNEMTSVPVSYNASGNGSTTSAVTRSFNLSAFYGTANVISECTVQSVGTVPSGITINTTNKSNPTVTIANGTTLEPTTELTFRVTYADLESRDVVFTIAAVMPGKAGDNATIYELIPSETSINVGRKGSTYNPAKFSLTCGYVKRVGLSAPVSVTSPTASFDGLNIYFRVCNRTSKTWGNYILYSRSGSANLLANQNVSAISKVEFIICSNTAATITASQITNLIDRETVPILVDGASPFMVDIDNEMTSVALDSDGHLTSAFSVTLNVSAFYGISPVTLDNLVTKVNPDNNFSIVIADDKKSITISRAASTSTVVASRTVFEFTATKDSDSGTLVFTLAGVRAGEKGQKALLYELTPSVNTISFGRDANNNLTPDSILVYCGYKKIEGESVSVYPGTIKNNLWTPGGAKYNILYHFKQADGSYTAYGWAKDLEADGVGALKVLKTTTHVALEYILTSATGIANVSDSNIIDRETIPIIRDGEKGDEGDPGNGIASVALARMFTMGFEAPSNTDSGWKTNANASDWPTEANLSQTNRYLWQRKTTTYTKAGVSPTVEVSLLNQYQNGVCANLLEDTAFREDNEMDAWEIHLGNSRDHAGVPQKTWACGPTYANQYTDFLRQKVYDSSLKKIKPNTWYTLSFWAAMSEYYDIVNVANANAITNDAIGNYLSRTDELWLSARQKMNITVRGKVATTNVFMRVFCWTKNEGSNNWIDTVSVDFEETSFTDKTFTVTNNQSGARKFFIKAYCYLKSNGSKTSTQNTNTTSNYRIYVSLLRIDRGCKLNSYLYRSSNYTHTDSDKAIAVDSASPWYVDGVKCTSATRLSDATAGNTTIHNGTYVTRAVDGRVEWQLTSTPKRHSVTFKTNSSFVYNDNGTNVDDLLRVLFRLDCGSHWGWVSMVKLEENTIATEWIENSYDRYAADFQHIYVGDWKASTNGTASTYYLYALGVRHCVRARKSATESDMTFFRMKKRTENTGYCSTTQPYADTTNWERADFLKFVAADLMLAEEVITDKLTVSKIRGKNDKFVLDENGNVTAQGGTYTQITAYQLVVNKGTLNDVQVKGSLRNPFTLVGDSFDTNYNDNVSMLSSGGAWLDNYSLPWDVSQSGRVLRLVNFKWGSSTAEGLAYIKAPTGKYFYEDGLTKSSLLVSREYIELVGYGTPTTFYGWIVVARIDLSTTKRYGHCLKILGFGRVTNTSSGATIDYTTFDGSTMSVTRSSTTGRYTVTFSSNWFAESTDVRVMVQGYGMVANSSTSPSKATLNSTTTTTFVVDISDGASRKNGNFDFIIFNGANFSIL